MKTMEHREGIITKVSTKNFEDTYTNLKSIISNNPNLKIIAEVDHTSNAAKNELKLNPTRLILFGNPNLGTPLMQNSQTVALDLPQKMLVWEDNNNVVYVSYNDPSFLVKRHEIKGNDEIVQTITNALDKISSSVL